MTSTITLDPRYTVQFPVHYQHVDELIKLRDKLMASDQPTPVFEKSSTETVVTAGSTHGRWTRELFGELCSWISDAGRRPAPNESYRGLYTLFDMIANAAGGWVTKAAAEEEAGVDYVQLRNELSSLTKLSDRITGDKAWPIAYRTVGRTYSYRMDAVVAEWWFDITGQEQGS